MPLPSHFHVPSRAPSRPVAAPAWSHIHTTLRDLKPALSTNHCEVDSLVVAPLELSLRCGPSELVLWYRCGILCPTRPLAHSPARSHPSPAHSPAHSLTPLPLTCRVPMPAPPTCSPSCPGTRPRRVSTLPLHTTPHISPAPLSVHALSAIDC